ncbi:hypothetical protein [Erwinia sp. HR93]|uniref:hypothetical protein n=1 Tax=Erwinia sp. HR93 TaxID=3094840 RepID=UPI002ADECD25|nr:hypothetical protein [Erwinia sp. HR93]MEA1065244.1 hypothetical protein [Erwinia sp. HR93]
MGHRTAFAPNTCCRPCPHCQQQLRLPGEALDMIIWLMNINSVNLSLEHDSI